jgi:hypothetical protein
VPKRQRRSIARANKNILLPVDQTASDLEAAETRVRRAEVGLNALDPRAPLRYGVAAGERLRQADANLGAIRAALRNP